MVAGGAVAASMLSCGGLVKLGTDATALDFGGSSCIEEGTMKKVLVTYASKCGSTAEVAQAIAEQLCRRGESVDVRPVDQVKDLSPYKAVVLGSAVRMGRWLPAAVRFVQEQSAALAQTPTALFTVHFLNTDDGENSRAQRASYVEPVHALITPRHEAFFAGKIESRRLDLGARLLAKAIRAEDADRRDWQAIRAWANQIFTV